MYDIYTTTGDLAAFNIPTYAEAELKRAELQLALTRIGITSSDNDFVIVAA